MVKQGHGFFSGGLLRIVGNHAKPTELLLRETSIQQRAMTKRWYFTQIARLPIPL
jgi:hypothetical protein